MIDGHGGNVWKLARALECAPSDITDMSSNVNPLGPPDGLIDFLKAKIETIHALPEADARSAVAAFADRHGVGAETVIAGNGTTELIHTIPLALGAQNAVIVAPTYSDYADACRMHGTAYRFFTAREADAFYPDISGLIRFAGDADVVFICNPNNPTGVLIPDAELIRLCQALPHACIVVDESYLPFVPDTEERSMIGRGFPNLMVLNSMSKIFRVPGLRIGFLTGTEALIRKMAHYALPWCLNSLSQAAVSYLMTRTAEIDLFTDRTRRFIAEEQRAMAAAVNAIPGMTPFSSCTSFLLIALDHGRTAADICAALGRERILIRNCDNFQGLSDRFIRISLKSAAQNRRIAALLAAFR